MTQIALGVAIVAANPWMSPPLNEFVVTKADTTSPVSGNPIDPTMSDLQKSQWQEIERKLIGWGCNLRDLDEEGTITPSRETIGRAIQLAAKLASNLQPAPTRVVPDVRGAVVFELQRNNLFESLHIQPDGTCEYRVFRNHRLEIREPWFV